MFVQKLAIVHRNKGEAKLSCERRHRIVLDTMYKRLGAKVNNDEDIRLSHVGESPTPQKELQLFIQVTTTTHNVVFSARTIKRTTSSMNNVGAF